MEFLIEYGLFLAKAVTVVAAVGIILALIVAAGQRGQRKDKEGNSYTSYFFEPAQG